MKRIFCMLLAILMLTAFPVTIFSEEAPMWETEYARIISQLASKKQSTFVLADFDDDAVPELVAGNDSAVSVYTYKNDSLVKVTEQKDLSIRYFEKIKKAQRDESGRTRFVGQVTENTDIVTYTMQFTEVTPSVSFVCVEHDDHTGKFYNSNGEESVPDCTPLLQEYFAQLSFKPFTLCTLSHEEISAAGSVRTAAAKLFARYRMLKTLPDNTASFSVKHRDAIKKATSDGQFAEFEKISKLNATDIFVQFYVNTDDSSSLYIPYEKRYALLAETNNKLSVTTLYDRESALDAEHLMSLLSKENETSNISIDYVKTKAFRGIDDYVNYFSSLLSSAKGEINENGKIAISEYMEYTVNRCSRTEIKGKNNIITVDDDIAEFISENAIHCMSRLSQVCESQGFVQSRKARIIPELVCNGIDFSKPIRIEYKSGISQAVQNVSGIRLMLDDTHGIYLTTADLSVLESSFGTFCMEYKKTDNGFVVAFADKNNQTVDYISAPAWFIVPAENEFSTVMATYSGGTDNWGGQFSANNKTIEFSTNYSGTYEIVENDITINDIEALSSETKAAIRFMVSKGIFTLDKRNNFRPSSTLNRYDFITALVRMFYAINIDAQCSFTDIPKNSVYYRYVASAQEQEIATGYADGTFRGYESVSKEQVITLCGRTLVVKKGYTYTQTDASYLSFADNNEIATWAKPDIAVAIRCGLLNNSGIFAPTDTVTRAEGAEILYKTFMLLYDVSPITTVSAEKEKPKDKTQTSEPIDFEFRLAICIFATVILLFLCYLAVKIKKHKRKKNETKIE